MATLIGKNFFEYFSHTQHPERAKCKICEKVLNSKKRSNLKKHLSAMHNVEVRLEKKPVYKKNHHNENSFNGTLESNQSNCEDSVSLPPPSPSIVIKDEIIQPTIIVATPNVVNTNEIGLNRDENDEHPLQTQTLETHYEPDSDDSAEDPPVANDIEYVEPIAKKIKNHPLNETTLSQKPRIIKTPNFRVDPLRNQHESPQNEDSLERALRKRKMLLEIEQLQIQNYDMKIKLWEKEQMLQLPHSRFTKEIASRKRAIEEEYYEAH